MTQHWSPKRMIAESDVILEGNRQVLFVWGWRADRAGCHCYWRVGMRMDNQEQTFALHACHLHTAIGNIVRRRMFEIPPSDRETSELAEALFENAATGAALNL